MKSIPILLTTSFLLLTAAPLFAAQAAQKPTWVVVKNEFDTDANGTTDKTLITYIEQFVKRIMLLTKGMIINTKCAQRTIS